MTGDPKVLAGLQQAFNTSDIYHVKRYIGYAWEKETDSDNVVIPPIDERIRAWTPPLAEPSLEQRVAELELKLSAVSATMQEHETDLENFGNQIHELFNRTDPEPTAPDDPVCAACNGSGIIERWNRGERSRRGCPDCWGSGKSPAPQPAPDLDPVRVEAAAKAGWRAGGRVTLWENANAGTQSYWLKEAEIMISTYLNGETR